MHDTRVIYCGDCIDVSHIDLPFSPSLSLRAEGSSKRNHEVVSHTNRSVVAMRHPIYNPTHTHGNEE